MLLGASLGGCFSDESAGKALETGLGETGEDGDTDDATPSGETADATGVSTGGTDDGETDTGGGDDDDGELGDDDCPLDCGEQAACQLDELGQAQCVCDDVALQWGGSQCLACSDVTQNEFNVDIPVIDAMFRITLDGAAFPNTPTERGRLYLRSRDDLDEVDLGFTGGDYMATVVAGRYDLFYEYDRGGAQIPLNRAAWLGDFVVDDAAPIEVDIRRALIDVTVLINGSLAPQTPSEFGRIVLVDTETGDEVLVTNTSTPRRALYVVPGEYEVRYRWVNGFISVPRNADGFVQDVKIDHTDEVQPLEIDVRFTEYTGDILINDSLAPASPTEYGVVALVSDERLEDRFDLAPTSNQSYRVNLMEGSYSVYYSHRNGGATVPANSWGRVGEFSPENPEIRIPSVAATGAITIGGTTPPTDGSNDGIISLRSGKGDHIVLANTTSGEYQRRIMPGTYDAYYSQQTAGGQVPANTNARLTDPVFISADASSASIDVDIGRVSGNITLNDELPPDSEYDDGRVYLRNRVTGDSVLLGNTRMGSFDKPVVPGTYDVVYVVESAGAGVPVNAEAIIRRDVQVASGGGPLPIDIRVGRLTGSILVGGEEPLAAGATVVLQDVLTGDEVFLGTLDDPSYDQALAAGRYLARYRGGPESYNGPENRDAAFLCLEVPSP